MNAVLRHVSDFSAGRLCDVAPSEAQLIRALRRWGMGPAARACMQDQLCSSLGETRGTRAAEQWVEFLDFLALWQHRPLCIRTVADEEISADEACLARFVTTATEGDREDAVLMATLLVRTDAALVLYPLAVQVGLALRQLSLANTSKA